MIVPPAVFGHELSGTISEIGPGATDWRVADRVVSSNSAPCGAATIAAKPGKPLRSPFL